MKLDGQSRTLGLRKAATYSTPPSEVPVEAAKAAATVIDVGAPKDTPDAVKPAAEAAVPGAPNRIPRQTLRIPKRVDDPN